MSAPVPCAFPVIEMFPPPDALKVMRSVVELLKARTGVDKFAVEWVVETTLMASPELFVEITEIGAPAAA